MFGGQGDEEEPARVMNGEGQQGRCRMESGSPGEPLAKKENCSRDREYEDHLTQWSEGVSTENGKPGSGGRCKHF